jgi:hypothetical protein
MKAGESNRPKSEMEKAMSKAKDVIYMICTKRGKHGHCAVAAPAGAANPNVHEGHGNTREDAIASALHRSRIFYADPGLERDILVAEARQTATFVRLHEHTLLPVDMAA